MRTNQSVAWKNQDTCLVFYAVQSSQNQHQGMWKWVCVGSWLRKKGRKRLRFEILGQVRSQQLAAYNIECPSCITWFTDRPPPIPSAPSTPSAPSDLAICTCCLFYIPLANYPVLKSCYLYIRPEVTTKEMAFGTPIYWNCALSPAIRTASPQIPRLIGTVIVSWGASIGRRF